MAEQLLPYALTSLQRVKDILWDPNNYLTPIGNTVSGSNVITNVSPMQNLQIGQTIIGTGIPTGTTIIGVGVGALTLSANATANGTNTQFTIVNQPSAFDGELTRMINAETDWFQSQTGRKLLLQQYLNDEESGVSYRQKRIVLRHYPVFYLKFSGDCVQGSNQITNCTNLNGVAVGMPIFGYGVVPQPQLYVPQNGSSFTTVTVISGTTITISSPCTATQTQVALEISGLQHLQYMSGTPVTNPAWTDYIPDQFKLKDNGRAGIVRVYGLIQRIYDSAIRATYWAGYLINWANAGDNLTHTLPAEISSCVENRVVRRFKRRATGDATSQSIGGSNVAWGKSISSEDQDVINRYRRAPIYF